ncbi:MAG TPA: TA system VapC family ribonuclease toxin [Solirubrobacteraceae bacterium]|nr:TA system VapC family ribonuclease toxin [Solirubrobacteraceae bacterium]
MSRALLDINVLLALLDSDHIEHARAHDWLDDEIDAGWASCAITENGFVRIISQPRYPSPVSPAEAIELLSRASDGHHHEFWPCDVRLVDPTIVDSSRLHVLVRSPMPTCSRWRWRTTGASSPSIAPCRSPLSTVPPTST